MLTEFPVGHDLSLINTIYHKSIKLENGKYSDAITLIYKDNNTGIKYHKTIDAPEFEYYKIKDEYVTDYNQFFIEKDKVETITVKYQDLLKDIASRTNNLEFYYENIKNGNNKANNRLHTHPAIMLSDMNIEDYYRFKFNQYYLSEKVSLTKSYLDIEADTISLRGEFPQLGECPINAITLIDGTSDTVYTLLLRNKNNPLIEQLENKLKTNPKSFFDKLRNTLEYAVNGPKNVIRYKLNQLDFQLNFYDDELQMIHDLFIIINKTQPDFVLAWNMAFDIPYIIERLKILGVNPESVMCHPDIKYKEAYYYIDERHKNDYAERGDFAKISSYSVFIDQMIHFASRRKGQSAIKSYSLDYIGQLIAKVKKLDYSHITTEIGELPYKDYETFVIYNIIDTIVQKCIELKTDDISYVFNKSNMNNTRYDKCHRNTIYLKNRGIKEFYKDGYIMGNNCNLDTEKKSFAGAIVADPKLIAAKGMNLNGVYVSIYDNDVDYDFKSLYPSMMIEFNIAPHTQIGKLFIDEPVYEKENPFKDPDYDRGGSFMIDMVTRQFLLIGHRWFGLASYRQLCEDIYEYFTKHSYTLYPLREITTRGFVPFTIINQNIKAINPIELDKNSINPITFYKFVSRGENNEYIIK